MVKNTLCKRFSDCSICSKTSEEVFTFNNYKRGKHFPADKCPQNCIIFMLKGELLVNSEEYPGTTLREGDFILQAIGSKLEILALSDVEYVQYNFNEPPTICNTRHAEVMTSSEEPNSYTPLVMSDRLSNMMHDLKSYLKEGISCKEYIEMKAKEAVFLMTCYYPLSQISAFFYPISAYTEGFHYFIMNNYNKVKNVEEFAQIGGYNITTFRRLFKNLYGVPVYEWILSKKRDGILNDLQNTRQRINEISKRYGFESASHFAHFCKSSFGDTPRSLRNKAFEER